MVVLFLSYQILYLILDSIKRTSNIEIDYQKTKFLSLYLINSYHIIVIGKTNSGPHIGIRRGDYKRYQILRRKVSIISVSSKWLVCACTKGNAEEI